MNEQDIAKNAAEYRLASVAADIADCKGSTTKANQLVAALRRLEVSAGHEAILKELEATMNLLANELEKIARAAAPLPTNAPTKALQGLRVLLAEDDDIAAAMTMKMLERNNAVATRVHDGTSAVAIVATNDFDLILMDVQMPGLSGLSATKIIRGEQKEKNTPIIALTAGKVEADSSYAEAGMNDAISKPYKEQKLVETILKCLNTDKPQEPTHETLPTKSSLYSLDKLTAMGDQGFVIRMLNLFIEQVPASVTKLKEAYHASDYETVKYMAHRLRPSIRNMGITSAEHEVDQIEELAEAGTRSRELEQLIVKVENVTNDVVHELGKYLEQHS